MSTHPDLIGPARVSSVAGLIVRELGHNPMWAEALRAATPVKPTHLVRRLDLPDSHYYVVPCLRGPRVAARVLIDAASGGLVEIGAAGGTTRSLARWITPREAIAIVLANESRIHEWATRSGIVPWVSRRESITVQPALVWKPCLESKSRFLPFYAVVTGDRFVYVRVDAKFAVVLTPPFSG